MATMMTAIMCFLFATMIVASGKFKTNSACLLAGFFLTQSFVSLHELMLYGDQFRYAVLESSPNWFFIGSLAYALDGPLLYLYVVSLIRPQFSPANEAQMASCTRSQLFGIFDLCFLWPGCNDQKKYH
jgi:hypothetical protein